MFCHTNQSFSFPGTKNEWNPSFVGWDNLYCLGEQLHFSFLIYLDQLVLGCTNSKNCNHYPIFWHFGFKVVDYYLVWNYKDRCFLDCKDRYFMVLDFSFELVETSFINLFIVKVSIDMDSNRSHFTFIKECLVIFMGLNYFPVHLTYYWNYFYHKTP